MVKGEGVSHREVIKFGDRQKFIARHLTKRLEASANCGDIHLKSSL